jgi:glycosyltransferase involved in cell wall biosynthesis
MHNVLVDLHRLRGNRYNGLYHFCYQLGAHLSAAPPGDMDLHFYVPKEKKELFGDKVSYSIQRSRDKFYRFNTGKFNVWHVATTLSWYRPFSPRTKNVFTIHDLNFLEQDEYNERSRKKYLQLIQRRVDRADYLTFISNFARKQALQHLRLGDKPYSIIYNGCNIPSSVNGIIPGYHPARPFLFAIGQLHSRKNFHVLPALLAGNDYELVIAGMKDFEYAQKIIEVTRRLGVSDRVKLIGTITDEEKNWYYQHCGAFVFPSTSEGFGLPVLEAMQFGKPVFLSRLSSLPEVGGEVAYYFDDFDPAAMRLVFEKGMNDFNSHDRIAALQQQAASFGWNKAAQQYLEVYRQLF